jgi:hypothetical protein
MRKKNIFLEFNTRYGIRPTIRLPRPTRDMQRWRRNIVREFWR